MTKPRAAVSWSGGKDCCLALYRAREHFEIAGLLTVFTEDGTRTRSHGLRPQVIAQQAKVLGLPLITTRADWNNYEERFETMLRRARRWNISHAIFGDVFPDPHRQWAQAVSARAGLMAVEPLWSESTATLAREFIRRGGRAVIVAAKDEQLDVDRWLGRELDEEGLNAFQSIGVDPGGENGEFHTVVTRFPDGGGEIALEAVERLSHGGCGLLDLVCSADEGRGSATC